MGPGLEFSLHEGELIIYIRLVIAALAGAAVGWNRFRAGKPAGVGTHALVALGAATFVAVPILSGGLPGSDGASRVIQGVAAGIGFLGAGEIFRGSSKDGWVHGLTSAAALWATAALGILAVYGSGTAIVAATTLILGILYLAPRIEEKWPPNK